MILLCGLFKNIVLLAMLIVPHELGHALMGELCGFHVKEIRFCPYGGNTVFDSLSNSSLQEEWMVLLAGPMTQMIVFYLLSFVLSGEDFAILKMYHYALLWFNLLPFYPLDGGKAVQLLFAFFLPYYRSLLVTILISFGGISLAILFALLTRSYQLTLILMLVFVKSLEAFQKRHFLFQSYLLTRYLHPRIFSHKKVITSLDQMYLGRSHVFRTNGMNWTEKVFLNHYFQSKKL